MKQEYIDLFIENFLPTFGKWTGFGGAVLTFLGVSFVTDMMMTKICDHYRGGSMYRYTPPTVMRSSCPCPRVTQQRSNEQIEEDESNE